MLGTYFFCFLFANLFAVFIYAQFYTYVIRAFNMGEYAGHIFYCGGILVSYFHVMYIFICNSNFMRRRFFENGVKILFSPGFWVGNAVFFTMTLFFAPNFAMFHITSALFPGIKLSFAAKKIIISFVMLLVNFALFYVVNLVVRAKWRSHDAEIDDSRGFGTIFFRVVAAFLFYLFLLGIVIRFAVTIIFYMGIFAQILMWAAPFLLAVLCLYLILLRLKKKAFEKKLLKLCGACGYEIDKKGHSRFILKMNGDVFYIIPIGITKFGLYADFLLRKNEFLKKRFSGFFVRTIKPQNASGKNFLVILNVFGKKGGFIENGEIEGEYRIFYSEAFLRSLERGVLGR